MKLSTIIINYNTDQLTLQAIDSVIKYAADFTYEIIVVDNNSKITSLATLLNKKPYKDKVTFIQLEENLGFGKANNKGAEIAKGEYVFLLNSDAYLIDNSIIRLIDFMDEKKNKKVACCGPKLINSRGEPNLSYGNFLSRDKLLYDIGLKKIDQRILLEKLSISKTCDFKEIREVDYLSGAALLIRKSVIDKYGLFNPKYFMYFEDMDLCFKYFSNGYKNVLVPDVTMVHIGGQSWTSNEINSYKAFRIIAKSKYIFSKNILNSLEASLFYILDYFRYLKQYFKRIVIKVLNRQKFGN